MAGVGSMSPGGAHVNHGQYYAILISSPFSGLTQPLDSLVFADFKQGRVAINKLARQSLQRKETRGDLLPGAPNEPRCL